MNMGQGGAGIGVLVQCCMECKAHVKAATSIKDILAV